MNLTTWCGILRRGKEVETPEVKKAYDYDELVGITFKLVNASDRYTYDGARGIWTDRSEDDGYMRQLVENGEDLTIVGVVQPSEDATAAMLMTGIAYPAELTEYIMDYAATSDIVRDQKADPDRNVLTGNSFGEDNDENGMGMDSMFSVDEKALQEAFKFDEKAIEKEMTEIMAGDDSSLDLSDMLDPSALQLQLPEFPEPDMEEILGHMDVSVSQEGMTVLSESLTAGYESYVSEPEHSGATFKEYMETDEAKQILAEGMSGLFNEDEIKAALAAAMEATCRKHGGLSAGSDCGADEPDGVRAAAGGSSDGGTDGDFDGKVHERPCGRT